MDRPEDADFCGGSLGEGRLCSDCREFLPLSAYVRPGAPSNAVMSRCTPCAREFAKRYPGQEKPNKYPIYKKSCLICSKIRHRSEFPQVTSRPDGLDITCIHCLLEARKHEISEYGKVRAPTYKNRRSCLKCDQMFQSQSIENRICWECGRENSLLDPNETREQAAYHPPSSQLSWSSRVKSAGEGLPRHGEVRVIYVKPKECDEARDQDLRQPPETSTPRRDQEGD